MYVHATEDICDWIIFKINLIVIFNILRKQYEIYIQDNVVLLCLIVAMLEVYTYVD